jgi:hypothetical protein
MSWTIEELHHLYTKYPDDEIDLTVEDFTFEYLYVDVLRTACVSDHMVQSKLKKIKEKLHSTDMAKC